MIILRDVWKRNSIVQNIKNINVIIHKKEMDVYGSIKNVLIEIVIMLL